MAKEVYYVYVNHSCDGRGSSTKYGPFASKALALQICEVYKGALEYSRTTPEDAIYKKTLYETLPEYVTATGKGVELLSPQQKHNYLRTKALNKLSKEERKALGL